MSFLGKLRVTTERAVEVPAGGAGAASAASLRGARVSNGLKDFLWHLSDLGHGHLLDLGPVWQSTVGFFTARGFKVYTEDVLRAWKEALDAEAERLRAGPPGQNAGEMDPAAVAERFAAANLRYPAETFHAVLAWDLFDYLESELVPRVVARLHELLRPNGVVLVVFHSRKPDGFHRYRVVDTQTVELLPAPAVFPLQRIFQNREILNLFGRFRSSKTFVGRDQLREGLFMK